MTLQFPTIAEQVLKEFQDAKRTTSIAKLAAKRGADKYVKWDRIEYVFGLQKNANSCLRDWTKRKCALMCGVTKQGRRR